MGIFTAWNSRKRKAFVERAEELAGSIQLEIYKHVKATLVGQYGEELAGKVAGCIANYVCRFGYINPIHESDKELLALCESERSVVLRALGDTFKTNATGVLILLGAAWSVDFVKFREHMSLLAREGFVKVGRETPNVSQDLLEVDFAYMHEIVSMDIAIERDQESAKRQPSNLPSGFMERIRTLKSILDEVYPKSFDDWVEGFELDGNPEKELLIWECMALTYSTFVEGRTLSVEAKKEAINVILQFSLGRTEEYILNSKRKVLHKVEVIGLVDCYRAAAETIFTINQGRQTK
jgi:hypothetical protein